MSSTTSTVLSANDPPARIAEEFTALLNRSQELFVGLYDLPTYSSPAVWKPYFQRAFSSFTRLWKFQQLHRVVLERDDVCGLKRHEIGEIASKIGQLYYNYYTRTSETGYLLDAYTFFEAVWDRKYFDKVMDTRLPSIASKRLRFCARFMIVCLLLNRWDRVQVLVVEMKRYVDAFAEVLDPVDKDGWRKTYSDMATLVDTLCRSAHGKSVLDRTPHNLRLPALEPAARETARGLVGEAILCCSWPGQVKFSDFSIDLFRIQQTLERDPVKCNPSDIKDPDCPRKYALYLPSVSNLLAHMSCSLKELQPHQYLLFYFSGPGSGSHSFTSTSSSGSPTSASMPPLSPGPSVDLMQCGLDLKPTGANASDINHDERLHVTDLLTFLRRPFVGIIDSPAAHMFRKVPTIYSAPFMFFMSPQEHPSEHKDVWDARRTGSLFTSFLAHPALALADLCGLGVVEAEAWDAAHQIMLQWHQALVATLVNHAASPKVLVDLVDDAYTQRLVVRFIVCRIVLTHHVHFVKTTELPCCHPDLPDVLWVDLEVISRDKLSKVLQALDCQDQFR